MVRGQLLPLLAIAGLTFSTWLVVRGSQPTVPSMPLSAPAKSPFRKYVAGNGVIEASSENIAVGPHIPGIVSEVLVSVGGNVRAGDPIFRIDDRSLRADLMMQQAAVRVAREQLTRLMNTPRAEDILPAEARVKEAEADLADLKSQLARLQKIEQSDSKAVTTNELERMGFNIRKAEARLDEVRATLAQLKAGPGKEEIAVADAEVAQAEARVKATQTDIDRLTVRSPVDGQILQAKVRVGEFAATGPLSNPLILVGNVSRLHIRASVDETEAWRVRSNAAALAVARGNSEIRVPLKFVRFEPFVVPKRALTGDSTERVDTRVLQVLYSFDPSDLPLYVGQQMDVMIEDNGNAQQPPSTASR